MKALYLRTKYSLNLKSGGSVAHTEGVINALKTKVDLDIVSNDPLNHFTSPIKIIKPILVNVPIINELFYNLKVILKLRKVKDYSFIYSRYSGESFSAAYLSSKNSIPLILEFNSFDTWKIKNWKEKGFFLKKWFKKYFRLFFVRKIESYNIKKAALIVVVSVVLKDQLIQVGVSKEKILVNPNGVDISKFKKVPKVTISSIKKKFQLVDHYIFGFIGTFGHWHGVIELAKAICLFYNQNPELTQKTKFLVIGDGHFMNDVKKIIQDSKWNRNVILTGMIPQSDGPAHLLTADCLISPHIPNPDGTKFFGSPTKLFEYMACAKPIIASDLNQIGEILSDEKTAFMVEPGNIQELAQKMKYVFSNDSKAKLVGENSFKLVNQQYTWDAHVSKILHKFKSIKS